jgi:hypothetical protein
MYDNAFLDLPLVRVEIPFPVMPVIPPVFVEPPSMPEKTILSSCGIDELTMHPNAPVLVFSAVLGAPWKGLDDDLLPDTLLVFNINSI